MKDLLLIITLLSVCIGTKAQIQNIRPAFKGGMTQYAKAEWDISLKARWKNPYDPQDIALDLVFIAPNGQKGILPCFYVKGVSKESSDWKARFAAKHYGEYRIWFELRSNGKIISTTEEQKVKSCASDRKGFLRKANDWTFRFDNGMPFRAIGENIGWECRDEDDSKFFKALHEDPRFNYDYMIPKLAASGGNFFRTWMIYWNLPVDWKTVKNNKRYRSTTERYNASGMERLDHLVEICDSLGVYMMLALESHVGYMGDGWQMSSYNAANGGSARTPGEFFSNSKSREQYKQKLRLMIARYGYSPAIAVWEFFNEVDHVMHDTTFGKAIPASVITDWHNEMATYLKHNDPYGHLVSTSVSHRDIEGMNDIAAMDFNQRHIYGNAFTIPQVLKQYATQHHKPYVIGECGYHWDWSLNFNQYITEFEGDFRKTLWLGLFSPTPILPMSWWGEFFEDRGMMSYFNIVQKINAEMLEAAIGTSLSEATITAPQGFIAMSVKAGESRYAYIYNNLAADSNNGEASQTICFEQMAGEVYRIEAYNTTTGDRKLLKETSPATDGKIQISSVNLMPQQSVVLIVTKQK